MIAGPAEIAGRLQRSQIAAAHARCKCLIFVATPAARSLHLPPNMRTTTKVIVFLLGAVALAGCYVDDYRWHDHHHHRHEREYRRSWER
jgi:hypothetical protein